ncbi:MAG: hypothetical protein FWE69_07810 [Clostridiales bacterium]|nr:hypothetical protein [Clostridiales bacterium]
MTFVNWLSCGIAVILVLSFVIALLYHRKKLRDLDGVVGILPPEQEDN